MGAEKKKSNDESEWNQLDELRDDSGGSGHKEPIVQSGAGAILQSTGSGPATDLALPTLDFSASEGFIQQWKLGNVKKKAAVDGAKKVIETQLKVLGGWLDRVVMAEDAKAENALKKSLATINAERLRIMRELGMANMLEAEQFMIDQTDQHLAMLRKVLSKSWPNDYKKAAVQNMETLWKRLNEEVMEESGSKFLKD